MNRVIESGQASPVNAYLAIQTFHSSSSHGHPIHFTLRGPAGLAVEKLADGAGERGEGGERRPLGGEAVEQVVLLAGEGVEKKQDPGMPLGQRISEGGLGLAKGSGVLPFSKLA